MENYSKLVCQKCGNTNLEEYPYGTPPISYDQCDSNFQNTWQSPYSQNFTDISQNSVIIPDLQSPMSTAQPLTFEAFDSLHDLKEHKHLEHQHKCDQCQRSFSDTVSYNRHTRNAHIHKLSKVNYPSLGYRINRSLILHYSDNPEQ